MNEMMLVMTGRTFGKWQLAAFAVGAGIAGVAAYLCNKWDKAYNDARSAGVVM